MRFDLRGEKVKPDSNDHLNRSLKTTSIKKLIVLDLLLGHRMLK